MKRDDDELEALQRKHKKLRWAAAMWSDEDQDPGDELRDVVLTNLVAWLRAQGWTSVAAAKDLFLYTHGERKVAIAVPTHAWKLRQLVGAIRDTAYEHGVEPVLLYAALLPDKAWHNYDLPNGERFGV